ncbi:MAG: ParB/RepB/Spo0J family partition protein [bacterium]|nr:ParB/RepB/Spo0J family partition protein [bacterium]
MDQQNIQEKRKESVFWIELDRIVPNPYQPRREFEEGALKDLAESIREYGVLQPIVVTRKEKIGSDAGSRLAVEYELLAGERRLRAAKLIGLAQIPVIIRDDTSNKVKLELALVENLQREDLNPMEKARAFKKLIDEFGMLQREVAEKIGKSREVVANTLRLLTLPGDMQQAVAEGKISEGHTRPLLMLTDHPEDQKQLYSNILTSNLSVREAERAARSIAVERARAALDPDTRNLQQKLENALGTRVHIERKAKGNSGKISIEFFSEEELKSISDKILPTQISIA